MTPQKTLFFADGTRGPPRALCVRVYSNNNTKRSRDLIKNNNARDRPALRPGSPAVYRRERFRVLSAVPHGKSRRRYTYKIHVGTRAINRIIIIVPKILLFFFFFFFSSLAAERVRIEKSWRGASAVFISRSLNDPRRVVLYFTIHPNAPLCVIASQNSKYNTIILLL